MNEKISVIVPIYNVKGYLDKCISSICSQTYKNIEIILVDDGSTDGGSAVCDTYAKRDNRIIVIHKENGGLTSARKAGVKIATGKYIGFVDGDDWIDENMYEEMLRIAVDNKVDMVMTDMFRHKFTGEVTVWSGAFLEEGKYDLQKIRHLFAENLIPGLSKVHSGVNGGVHVKLFKSNIIKKHLMRIDDKITGFADDKIIIYPILLLEKSIYVHHKAYYHGIDRVTSATHVYNPKLLLQLYYVYDYLKDIFEKTDYVEQLIVQLDAFLIQNVIDFTQNNKHRMIVPKYFIDSRCDLVGKRVVLYGAGKVGVDYFEQIKQRGGNIVLWVDKMPKSNNIKPVSALIELDVFDCVIIAVKDSQLADYIKNQLYELGVDEGKVIWYEPLGLLDIYK